MPCGPSPQGYVTVRSQFVTFCFAAPFLSAGEPCLYPPRQAALCCRHRTVYLPCVSVLCLSVLQRSLLVPFLSMPFLCLFSCPAHRVSLLMWDMYGTCATSNNSMTSFAAWKSWQCFQHRVSRPQQAEACCIIVLLVGRSAAVPAAHIATSLVEPDSGQGVCCFHSLGIAKWPPVVGCLLVVPACLL